MIRHDKRRWIGTPNLRRCSWGVDATPIGSQPDAHDPSKMTHRSDVPSAKANSQTSDATKSNRFNRALPTGEAGDWASIPPFVRPKFQVAPQDQSAGATVAPSRP